jgi:hypothetical protein
LYAGSFEQVSSSKVQNHRHAAVFANSQTQCGTHTFLLFSLASSFSLIRQIASLAFINLRAYFDTDCETMSNTETISNVPLDLIGPSLKIPDMFVALSRGPQDDGSFTGSTSHPHELGWIQSVVRPLESVDSLDQDPSRGARSYGVTLPSSEVTIPENPSFKRKDKVGWCCDLVTTNIDCTVSDAKGRDGLPSSEARHTQKCQVQCTLVLDPGIAGCLEDEASTPPLGSPGASVRAYSWFKGYVLISQTQKSIPTMRGSATAFTPDDSVCVGCPRPTPPCADHISDSTVLTPATRQCHPL